MKAFRLSPEASHDLTEAKPKRDSSLHRPTRSQEANGKGNGVGLFRSE
jgi:hypothetical protein